MKKRGYAIAMNYSENHGRTVQLKFLSIDKWVDATCFSFTSPYIAAQFAKNNKVVENRPRLGSDSCPYIIGPKGGIYSIVTGNPVT